MKKTRMTNDFLITIAESENSRIFSNCLKKTIGNIELYIQQLYLSKMRLTELFFRNKNGQSLHQHIFTE